VYREYGGSNEWKVSVNYLVAKTRKAVKPKNVSFLFPVPTPGLRGCPFFGSLDTLPYDGFARIFVDSVSVREKE
jgi:hypothetical protein